MSLSYNKFLLPACILLASFAFISCKKNDNKEHPLVSGNFVFDKLGNFSSIRMFTRLGEVKDQSLIGQYKIKFSEHIYPTAPTSSDAVDTFNIIDEHTARHITRNSFTNELMTKDFVITKMDNHYQFRSKDTSRFMSQPVDRFMTNIGKYKPYYFVTPTPVGGSMVTTLQYFYASPTAEGLVFPFINVIRFATINNPWQPYSTYVNVNRVNNVFDEKFPLNTLIYDTLLVQSFNVTYKETAR
ncbi:hypothetical protein [Longitalea luteola]|uniref:hypothetical protein n=1 Tax=Longitalea luteola TaxID=2812563 RepID=UPI001A97896C|nr:hypothetical protein [Longitalea luteola]